MIPKIDISPKIHPIHLLYIAAQYGQPIRRHCLKKNEAVFTENRNFSISNSG